MSGKLFSGNPLGFYEGMSDEEILGVAGVGPKTLERIRAAAQAEQACATCGEALSAEAVEKGHKHCPKCYKAYKAQRKGEGGKRQNGWVPAQSQVEEALTQVKGILKGIKARSTNGLTGEPRYDFSPADALLVGAVELYKLGSFGQVELGGKSYQNILDALYQGVLGMANEIMATGRLADARRIATEESFFLEPIVGAEEDVAYLLAEGEARKAADKAYEVLQKVLASRREERKATAAAQREAFASGLGVSVGEYIGGKGGKPRKKKSPKRNPPSSRKYDDDRRVLRDTVAM